MRQLKLRGGLNGRRQGNLERLWKSRFWEQRMKEKGDRSNHKKVVDVCPNGKKIAARQNLGKIDG